MVLASNDETRARVLRLLRGGRCSLRRKSAAAAWGLYPMGDLRRRPILHVINGQVDCLCASGDIRRGAHAEEYVLTSAADAVPRCHHHPPLRLLQPAPRRGKGVGFALLDAQMRSGRGPLTEREANAAARLAADAERAMAGNLRARDIDLVRIDKSIRPGHESPVSSERARLRLDRLAASCTDEDFRWAWAGVVDGWSFARLAKLDDCVASRAPRRLCEALRGVADGYDSLGPDLS